MKVKELFLASGIIIIGISFQKNKSYALPLSNNQVISNTLENHSRSIEKLEKRLLTLALENQANLNKLEDRLSTVESVQKASEAPEAPESPTTWKKVCKWLGSRGALLLSIEIFRKWL